MKYFWIPSTSGQGGHVQHAADFFSAAGDVGAAVLFTRLSVVGRQADQRGDLVAIELAQFGQMRQEHSAGLRADAWGAAKETIFMLQVIVGLNVVVDEFVEFSDLMFEGFDHFSDAFSDLDMMDHFSAIGFLSEQGIELSTSCDQFGEGLEMGCFRQSRLGVDDLAEVSEGVGIDGIGLGEFSETSCEVADLSRVGDDDVVAGLEEFDGKRFFVTAGSFENDLGYMEIAQALNEVPVALSCVEIAAVKLGGAGSDVKRFFGDVDADEKWGGHGVLPFLPMRAWRRRGPLAQAAVRVRSIATARTSLCDGLSDLGTTGLTPPLAAASARYARLSGSQNCTYGTINHAFCQHTRHEGTKNLERSAFSGKRRIRQRMPDETFFYHEGRKITKNF